MSITVNADDFGKDCDVSRAIDESFDNFLINRTTLMTNMPYAKEAMDLAKRKGYINKVGIHINLTAGNPLSENIKSNRVMCDEKGEFTADFARNIKTRFVLDAKTRRDVEAEIRAQFDKYAELGGILWHVDSHHHVHTDPSIWFILKKVLKDYPVDSVRLGRNMYRGGNPLMHIYKAIYNKSVRRFCKSKKDYFGSMADFVNWCDNMNDTDKSSFIANNDIEIMVHPMYDDSGILTDSCEEFVKVL